MAGMTKNTIKQEKRGNTRTNERQGKVRRGNEKDREQCVKKTRMNVGK